MPMPASSTVAVATGMIGQFRRKGYRSRSENGDGTIRRLRWTVAEVLVRASDQIDAKGLLIVYWLIWAVK